MARQMEGTPDGMKFKTAVVVGKFYPPHRGHKFLIDAAVSQSEQVTVIVCDKKNAHEIPGELRGRWIREIHPTVRVLVIDDVYSDDDSAEWAQLTIGWLGAAPEVVFTSENYGDRYAACMGSRHIMVDRERVHVPCSGTAIRGNPFGHWEFIEPPVKAWFAKRICVLGAESTGTTTLARSLADALGTCWVPEYGREYSELKLRRGKARWSSDEFVSIAREQNRQEEEFARQANKLLICDTNAFATTLWHRRYMGFDSPEVAAVAAQCPCHLYLLTGDEIPFVQDGTRDGKHLRHEMQGWFRDALARQSVPWQELHGSPEARLQEALQLIRTPRRELISLSRPEEMFDIVSFLQYLIVQRTRRRLWLILTNTPAPPLPLTVSSSVLTKAT
jgi:HTH-type transcriptional repressor of NAD biosynthesis genes